MRGVFGSLAIVFVGCAQLYVPGSKNPALVQVPRSAGFGVGDQIHLVAIDGVSVDASSNAGNEWRIDPGVRRLTIAYEASKKIVGPRVATSPLILTAKLEPDVRYQVVCESSKKGVKVFLRRSNGRIVSNVAESSLMLAPPTYPSPPPNFQIPAVRRH